MLTTLEDQDNHFSNKTWIFDLSNTLEPLFFNRLGQFGRFYLSQLSFDIDEMVNTFNIEQLVKNLMPFIESSTIKKRVFESEILRKKRSLDKNKSSDQDKTFEKTVLKSIAKHSSKAFNLFHRGHNFWDKSIIKINPDNKNDYHMFYLSILKFISQLESKTHNKPHRIAIYDPEGLCTQNCVLANILNQTTRESRKQNLGIGYFTCNIKESDINKVQFFTNTHHVITTTKDVLGHKNTIPVLGNDVTATYQRYDGEPEEIELKQLKYFKDY
jgi:hypothetical protein